MRRLSLISTSWHPWSSPNSLNWLCFVEPSECRPFKIHLNFAVGIKQVWILYVFVPLHKKAAADWFLIRTSIFNGSSKHLRFYFENSHPFARKPAAHHSFSADDPQTGLNGVILPKPFQQEDGRTFGSALLIYDIWQKRTESPHFLESTD